MPLGSWLRTTWPQWRSRTTGRWTLGRVAEIVGYVLDRYPYLAEVTEDEEPEAPAGDQFGPSGRPTNVRKRQVTTDLTALQKKFPALRQR